ncbi:MAG: LolA-like outer membrane lipoprotein chaperone [Campylobacterota bacterium]|nr:LolA-like outer membrane lipoprotein chaperone [Campylobacterota bacterium]
MKLLISFILVIFYANASNLKDITSYQASFTQSIVNSSNKEILYNGTIYIKKPSDVLWKYNDPIIKNVYILSNQVIIIEPDLEQVIISTLKEEINILDLLKNSTKISKNRYEAIIYDKKYILTIKNNQLTQINYSDEIENKVTIYFKDIKQNHKISSTYFKFKIPNSYDVIRK